MTAELFFEGGQGRRMGHVRICDDANATIDQQSGQTPVPGVLVVLKHYDVPDEHCVSIAVMCEAATIMTTVSIPKAHIRAVIRELQDVADKVGAPE